MLILDDRRMRRSVLIVGVAGWVLVGPLWAGEGPGSRPLRWFGVRGGSTRAAWSGPDLQLTGETAQSHTLETGHHLLVFPDGFSMALSGHEFSSDRAVVWVRPAGPAEPNVPSDEYAVQVYLEGRISRVQAKGGPPAVLKEVELAGVEALVVAVRVAGDVFVTVDDRRLVNPAGSPLYATAIEAFKQAGADAPPALTAAGESVVAPPGEDGRVEAQPRISYTVSYAPVGDVKPVIELTSIDDEDIRTVIGRIYVWWQEPSDGQGESRLLEAQADALMLWQFPADSGADEADPSAANAARASAIYVAGDVLLRAGQNTVRADELYYDLRHQRGLARNAVLRSFDPSRNIPIYVRAGELRQMAEGRFEANDVVLTTSEFWRPQMSVRAGQIRITDRIEEVGPDEEIADSSYEAEMKDVRFNYYDTTIFRLPSVRGNLTRPDVPLRSIRAGHDNTFGTSVETDWFLSRLLGLREPEGTDSTLSLDYYGDRGPGGGVDVEYERDTYFGRFLGYAIYDRGKDRLGRNRKEVDFPDPMRGRVEFQHRHYLPNSWQLTAELSYQSDKNFLEQYYRSEFNAGKERETLLHLKRIEDNWAVAALGKARLNDFVDQVEEQPSAEHHWTGQSLFGDRFVFFSDNQASRYRYQYSSEDPPLPGEPQGHFTFATTRNELDMPLTVGKSRVVPFVAGTFGYEDGGGFQAQIDDTPLEPEDTIWVGEAGVRASTQPFWSVYPGVKSRLWDVNGIRHIVRPRVMAVAYGHSSAVAKQRDTLDLGLSQRWQTKRGPVDRQRTVDWLELDLDFVWVEDPGEPDMGPNRLLWNQPFVPWVNRAGDVIPPLDRRTTAMFGPRRDYAGAEMILRLSDTTSVLSDAYVDMRRGDVEQFDVGFARLCWPNLSYYIGSRYLRSVENGLGQKGSHAVTFSATYVLDPRYTAVFSQQYDFDYGANIRSDITLIRRYHRMNFAVTLSADESLDEERLVLSLWPEGVPELGIGMRRHMELGAQEVY